MKNKYFDKVVRSSYLHKELVKDMRDQSMTKIIASENDVFVFKYVHYAGSYICKKGNQIKFFYFEGDLNPLYHFCIDSKEYRAYLKLSDLYAKRANRCRRTDSIYAINRQKPSKRYRKYKRTKFRITSSYPLYSYQNAALERIRAKHYARHHWQKKT